MTEQTTNTEVQTPAPDNKGLPEGVLATHTDVPNRAAGAPPQPEIKQAPAKEPTEEEKKATEEAAKAEADKKAAEEAAAEEETQVEEDLTEYPDYGDETANSVVAMLVDAKVDIKVADGFFREAMETGDMSKIKVSELVEAVGKEKASLIMLGVKDYYNRMTNGVADTVTAVHAEVGGEQNWAKIRDWARTKAAADPAFAKDLAGYNQMFDLNQTAAVMAIQKLRTAYEADGKNSSLVRKQVQGDSAVSTAQSGFEPITRGDYLAKMKEAHQRGDEDEMARLRAQRTATRQTY